MSDKIVTFKAHRALALPEILSEILVWIEDKWNGPRWVLNCALVNKTWFHEAIRILWGSTEIASGIRLDEIMITIRPDRRQMYADLVREATVRTYNQETEAVVQPALENLVFPKLHTLYLDLVFRGWNTEESIRAPALNMPNLQTLHIDRWRAPISLYPHHWDYLTDRIPVCFNSYHLLHKITNRCLCTSRSFFQGC